MFGYFDLVFFVPEAVLLTVATRSIANVAITQATRGTEKIEQYAKV